MSVTVSVNVLRTKNSGFCILLLCTWPFSSLIIVKPELLYLSIFCVFAIPAGNVSGPSQPNTVLEALEQRMAKYKEAFTQAKASGDERKARMHDRIAKVSKPVKMTPKPHIVTTECPRTFSFSCGVSFLEFF